MDKPAKSAWFKRNKATYEPQKRHAFDEAGVYAEAARCVSKADDENVYRYIPQDDWILREMQLGRCGHGTPQDQYKVGLDKWKATLMDKRANKRQVGQSWLVGICWC